MPDKIGDWSPSTLTRFIQDVFQRNPTRFSETLVVDDLTVVNKLTVDSDVSFVQNNDFRVVGTTGSPGFQNSWVNNGSPYLKAAYIKLPDGFVELVGVIKSGAVGSAAFTLPPGFRPAVAPGPFAVVSNGAFGRVDVGTDGTVTPISPSSNLSVSLSGIRFKVA